MATLRTLLLAGMAGLAACSSTAPGPQPGVYESVQCETTRTPQGNPQHAKRQLEIGAAGSAWQFTVFADADCRQAVLRVQGRTQAEVLGPAAAIPGAVAVRVRFLDRRAVAYTADAAALLTSAGCGSGAWVVGVEQAIGQGSCLGMPSITACPFDHDVLRLDDTGIQTGQRPPDGTLCTPDRRPTALDPAPLQRR